ncbi:MAG: glycosyltransferase family 9 protein [Deltaproteobacteria bacterium]|nr:glycosyltransferase family 9 protein [Deltaproteobacteria bacterium]
MPAELRDIKRVLIFTGGGIGDIVMSLTALRSIGECFKGKEIDIAISSRVRDIVDNVINWNDVIVWDKGLVKKTITRSLMSNYGLYFNLRKRKYDLLIDIEAIESWQAAIKRFLFYKLISPGKIAGRNTDGHGFFLDYGVYDSLYSGEHEVNRRLSLVETLGCKTMSIDTSINIDESYRKYADNLLIDKGIAESDFVVGINPNAFKQSCQWGVDRFISLSKRILEIYKAKIVVIGSEDDRTLTEKVVEKVESDNCIALTGLRLMHLSAVISRFHIFITNDTGPMHIAAAVKTPVVAVIGQDHKRYAPYMQDDNRRILYIENLPCRPCNKFDCNNKLCLDPISVDMVWDNFRSLADNILRMRNDNNK